MANAAGNADYIRIDKVICLSRTVGRLVVIHAKVDKWTQLGGDSDSHVESFRIEVMRSNKSFFPFLTKV